MTTSRQLFDANTRETYKGTKTLVAWPLTRGEYNDYRGWKHPENEDQSVAGYLVEYEPHPDEEPNDPRHAGYISWSPATVFERTYAEVSTSWENRLIAEGRELAERLDKLRDFMQTTTFAALPLPDRELMAAQERYMTKYLDVLVERVQRIPPTVEEPSEALDADAGEE